jgi:biopolymer transport protein ExbD
MTPMIDIVFQLLIFFLVTAQMAEQTRAKLSLPQEEGERSAERAQSGLTINLLADGTIVVNDAAVSLDELDALIDEAIDVAGGADKLKPLIRADFPRSASPPKGGAECGSRDDRSAASPS